MTSQQHRSFAPRAAARSPNAARRVSLTVGLLLSAALPTLAFADHYVDDPCVIPAPQPIGAGCRGAAAADCGHHVSFAPELVAKRASLVTEGQALDASADQFNARCNIKQVAGSAPEVACARDEAALNARIAAYDRNVAAFDRQLDASYGAAEQAVKARLAATALKLKAINRNGDALEAETAEWVRMGETARQHARVTAFEKLISLVSEGVIDDSREDAELTKTQLDAFKRWYRDTKRVLPDDFQAEMGSRILTMRTRADVATMLNYIAGQQVRVYEVVSSAQEGHAWEPVAQGISGVLRLSLSLMKKVTPQLKLGVDLADLFAANVDGWQTYLVAKSLTDKTLEVRDLDLRAATAVADFYRRDVERLLAIKAQRKQVAAGCHG